LYVQTTKDCEEKTLDYETDNDEQDCKLNGCLFFCSAKLARVFNKIAEDAFARTGLSPSHALVLYIVNQYKTIHQKEIGEKLHLTPSTITRFIEKLEGKKLVSKSTEGKNVYIHMTEQGLQMQPEIVLAWKNLHDRYKNILTEEEVKQFITISGKLLDQLGHEDE
jgi:DNA-binding MarR family transcriptional regulator